MTDEELQAIRERWPNYISGNVDTHGVARSDIRELIAEVKRLRAELAAVRIACAAYKALATICPECGGSGEVDSGGVAPWGEYLNTTCPMCDGRGTGYADMDEKIAAIESTAQPSDKLPTSGFFTTGRWDFTE